MVISSAKTNERSPTHVGQCLLADTELFVLDLVQQRIRFEIPRLELPARQTAVAAARQVLQGSTIGFNLAQFHHPGIGTLQLQKVT